MTMHPETVTHDQYLAAMEPLLALCGTDAMSVFVGLTVVETDPNVRRPDGGWEWGKIKFISAVDPGDGTIPVSIGEGKFAEQGWPVTVTVIQ